MGVEMPPGTADTPHMTNAKQPYEDPKATVIGDVLSLTAGFKEVREQIDKSFQSGTKTVDLTYS
ncbi:MAG: hypothetical protein JWM12_980 [Ilumatobacteraceae bacterium]|jgi:hypothetical protein|nr:hypothetical protein [Ilumatobacteraceae bacterium]